MLKFLLDLSKTPSYSNSFWTSPHSLLALISSGPLHNGDSFPMTMSSITTPQQNASSNPKANKRKRKDSNADGAEREKAAQHKQTDEYFYQPLHEFGTINIATVEAFDLLSAFRQWPDHLQLSIPIHLSGAIHHLSTNDDAELMGRYLQVSRLNSIAWNVPDLFRLVRCVLRQ